MLSSLGFGQSDALVLWICVFTNKGVFCPVSLLSNYSMEERNQMSRRCVFETRSLVHLFESYLVMGDLDSVTFYLSCK